jgi:hypothetical protein
VNCRVWVDIRVQNVCLLNYLLNCLLAYLLTYLLARSLTHSLTPCYRTLFENLIVTQLVKNILLSLWNAKVHYRVHKSPLLDPILSQPNPVRLIDSYLLKVNLNVILPPTPRSFQWSLTYGSPSQNLVNTSPPCVPRVPLSSSSLI